MTWAEGPKCLLVLQIGGWVPGGPAMWGQFASWWTIASRGCVPMMLEI